MLPACHLSSKVFNLCGKTHTNEPSDIHIISWIPTNIGCGWRLGKGCQSCKFIKTNSSQVSVIISESAHFISFSQSPSSYTTVKGRNETLKCYVKGTITNQHRVTINKQSRAIHSVPIISGGMDQSWHQSNPDPQQPLGHSKSSLCFAWSGEQEIVGCCWSEDLRYWASIGKLTAD